jgi:branched-chain amino acid transport system permease protein
MSVLPEVLRVTVGPLQQSLFGHEYISPAIIRQGVYGIAMVVIMLYRPAGLWPAPKHEDRIAKLNKRSGKQAAA